MPDGAAQTKSCIVVIPTYGTTPGRALTLPDAAHTIGIKAQRIPKRHQLRLDGGRAATVDEIAELFVFLASDKSGYPSGTIVTVDGGITSRRSVSQT